MHLASWAQADLPLAMDLLAGDDDVRPGAAGLLRRALSVLPAAVCGRPRVRADAGYSGGSLARAVVGPWSGPAATSRSPPNATPRSGGPPRRSTSRPGATPTAMPCAQVAACDYAPAGWPPDRYTIARRVKLSAERSSRDPRSR